MMKETFAFALILAALLGCASPGAVNAAKDSSAKLVLVTLDGVRWQEIFGGIDLELIQTEDFSRHPEHLKQAYWREGREQRREQLFPFLWSTVAKQGVFPYILNTQRSELPVNAGFSVASNPATEKSRWLNEVSAQSPALWDTVRLDYLTHGYAMEALKNKHPLAAPFE